MEIQHSLKSVSVALATYNGSAYIAQLLDSLLRQSLKPFEIFIIDDFSSDNTVEIIKLYQKLNPEIKYIVNDKNLGVTESFKKAVSYCSGDYFALCDQDDIWLDNKIELSMQYLLTIEELDKPSLVFTDLILIDQSGGFKSSSFWATHKMDPDREYFYTLLYGNILTGCTIIFNSKMRTELLRMPASVLMHDHWLGLIAYSQGKVQAIHQPTVLYRDHNESVTSKREISLLTRLLTNLKMAFNGEQYLLKNILQAEVFKNMYYSKLSKKDRLSLDIFLSLKHTSILHKKACAFRRYLEK